jgi:DNA-binding NtrC family response regulator
VVEPDLCCRKVQAPLVDVALVALLRLLETKTFRRLDGRKAIKVDVRLKQATAQSLGISRRALYNKLKRYDLG